MTNYKKIIVSENGNVSRAIIVDKFVYFVPCWATDCEVDIQCILWNADFAPVSAFKIEGIFYTRNTLLLPAPEPEPFYDDTYDDTRIPRRIGFGKFWSLR